MAYPEDPFQANLYQALLRTRGMNPGIPQQPQVQQPQVQQPQAPEVFTPERQAQDAFMQSVNQMPQRESPSGGRRFAGIMAGIAGGPSAADQIMYSPYYRQMGEWKERTNALGDAAAREGQANTQNRLAINDSYRADQGQQRIDVANKNADTSRMRAEVYAKLSENQGSKVVKDNQTGKQYIVYRDGRKEDLGIGTFSFEDELKLRQAGRLEILNLSSQNAQELENVRAGNRQSLAEFQAQQARELAEFRGEIQKGINADKASNPDQMNANERKIDEYLRARRWLNDHPGAENYLTLGDPGTNDFRLKEPSTFLGGSINAATQKGRMSEYEQAKQFINGTGVDAAPIAAPPPAPSAKPSGAPAVNPDSALRQQAVDALKKNNKPITEANIKYVVEQLKKGTK